VHYTMIEGNGQSGGKGHGGSRGHSSGKCPMYEDLD
jgi:hypothetical protein